MIKHATFSNITDEAVRGSYEKLTLIADKLPAKKHGMEQWKLEWVSNGKTLNQQTVKCTVGQGAEEARAILQESALYWNRKA